jgi:hypothetical protein
VIIAADNDAGGRKLAAEIEDAVQRAGRPDLIMIRDLPPGGGSDWNQGVLAQTVKNLHYRSAVA